MPITAKFSEEFYQRLGHKVADEIVDWFNKVDATYRSEFRELFAVHFAAFDAKLEQRLSEVRSEVLGELRKEVGDLRTEFRTELARMETRLIRWLFLFWVTNIGLMIALLKL